MGNGPVNHGIFGIFIVHHSGDGNGDINGETLWFKTNLKNGQSGDTRGM